MGGGEKKENGTEVENDDIHGTRTTPMKYMYYMYLSNLHSLIYRSMWSK